MEFKGTKEKWNYNGNEVIYDENGYAVIPSGNVNFEEKEYNFKLASKAPEMLEFLNQLLYACDNGLIQDLEELGESTRQLIKSATEL